MSRWPSKPKTTVVIVKPTMDWSDVAAELGLTDAQYWAELEAGDIVTLQIRTTREGDNGKAGGAARKA
jgi:hypothetical protein